ncbi:hypothetical protein KIH86_13820 [Paenibacillus sp. HN-1]|uniref:hypothetical protein n=1 Tax=Paenibacillus TaxID=44249 RepID=UPI001CA87884|nr:MULTISPECIES: hypothetical protein [Paenibacillus]MBY9082391.1 hypothetical protein [Paenibacillus sp. CGMCC 1.18879]MBY9085305.1 hypothetical protein [Paenibacillus sinensis]
MPNRYTNIDGNAKISETYTQITDGFTHVQQDIDADRVKLDGIATGAGTPGSATDSVIGNRTATDSVTPGFTGTLTALLSSLFTLIKGITGKSSALTAPATTLEATKAHMDNTDVHTSTAEHTKLAGIAAGAQVNQPAFAVVNDVEADDPEDTMIIAGGTGITISSNPATKTLTVTATGTATPGAHASSHITGGADVISDAVAGGNSGLMSGSDAQFVREDGETKTGAQAKADDAQAAAITAAEEYARNLPYNVYRQALINGNFDVSQRGGVFTGPPASSGYGPDRWNTNANADGGSFPTVSRTKFEVPPGDLDGSSYFLRISSNGAGSGFGAYAEYSVRQVIENGVRLLAGSGKKVTVSFLARSSIPGKKIGVRMYQFYGYTGSPSPAEILNGTHWTLTPNWTRYTFTFTTNTLAGKTFGNDGNDLLGLDLHLMWGSAIAAGVGDTVAETFVGNGGVDIAQVQLCAGDIALPFQPRSYADELRLCQRYYDLLTPYYYTQIGTGVSGDSNTVFITIPINVRPRTNPTYKFTGSFSLVVGSAEYTIQAADVTVSSVSLHGGQIQISGTGMPTIAAGLPVKLRGNADSFAAMDAEL